MKKVRIICRNSRLSLIQAELVKQKILSVHPVTEVVVIGRTSRGDRELKMNLADLEGTDFFTEEIFAALERNEADIAVHSLKDMSAEHFFSHDAFAVVDRDDTRDVAIFNPSILDKIKTGKTIIVGTCSPRREGMAVGFLKKALPQLHAEIKIETKSIRGNVESRLQQLHEGKYDATILATAGLNRLLSNPGDNMEACPVRELLKNKKLMLLPLVECVPAPCQGAIVAEAHPENRNAVALLKKINVETLFQDAFNEKKIASQYGTGSLQRFGVTTIQSSNYKTLYAAGLDCDGNEFNKWSSLPCVNLEGKNTFSSIDYMRDFFEYDWIDENFEIEQPVVFISNYKAVQHNTATSVLQHKVIYASGTKTWFELAKLGLWVNGSADALGFELFMPVLMKPLINISANDICILTHQDAAKRWKAKGYQAKSNYQLQPKESSQLTQKLSLADFIFWSSYSQYKYFGQFCKGTALHSCPGGETATLLSSHGLKPIIFPTIKAFTEWRKYSSRLINVA